MLLKNLLLLTILSDPNVAFVDQNQVIEKEIYDVLQKSELKKFTDELSEGIDSKISEGEKIYLVVKFKDWLLLEQYI